MLKKQAAFAVPGALTTKTGGYLYDLNLLNSLRKAGWDVAHVALPDGFPDPGVARMDEAMAMLRAVPGDHPVIVDGLAFGAIDPEAVKTVAAPIIALTHHPLALEPGLSPDRAAHLAQRERANLALARHVVVPSPHVGRVLVRDFSVPAEKLTVAEPGVARKKSVTRPAVQPTVPLILSVGLIAPRKGHDVLLRALARVRDLSWQATIVGRTHAPDTLADLIALTEELDLTSRVSLAGEVSDDHLQALYQSAAVFALATRYEGYGMVFAEALCHGLPILSCRTGAVPDTVPESAGRLVDIDDDAAFARGLRALLCDQSLRARLSNAARQAAERLPTWDDTARVVAGVLQQVVG